MMRKVKRIIICAVMFMLIAQLPMALAEETKVSISAPEKVQPGGTFSAKVMIEGVEHLDAAQFDLTFDSDVIAVVDVKNGKIEGEDVPILAWNFKPGSNNYIRAVCDLPGADGVSGSGYLAEIIFEVKGTDSEKSSIEILNGDLRDNTAEEIQADWSGCEVEVSASATPLATESQGSSYQGSAGYTLNETETKSEATTTTGEKITRSIPSLPAERKTSVVFRDIDISMVTLEADQDLSDLELSIERVEKPAGIPEPEKIPYAYFSIELNGAEGRVVRGTIDFKVAKSWINENSIDKTTITLNRYHDGKWQVLPTFMAGEENDVINYEAETKGFSYFVITGEVLKSESTATAGMTSTPPTPGAMESREGGGVTWGTIIAAMLVTAGICMVVFLLLSKRK